MTEKKNTDEKKEEIAKAKEEIAKAKEELAKLEESISEKTNALIEAQKMKASLDESISELNEFKAKTLESCNKLGLHVFYRTPTEVHVEGNDEVLRKEDNPFLFNPLKHAEISWGTGMTRSLGNYESFRFDCSIKLFCDIENIDGAMSGVQSKVSEIMKEKDRQIKDSYNKRNG